MKNLPNIYKNEVDVNNNRKTFYSKEEKEEDFFDEYPVLRVSSSEILNVLSEIFKQKNFSYTKRVILRVGGRTYETRLIREEDGKVLTIDNEIIDIDSIDNIEIIK